MLATRLTPVPTLGLLGYNEFHVLRMTPSVLQTIINCMHRSLPRLYRREQPEIACNEHESICIAIDYRQLHALCMIPSVINCSHYLSKTLESLLLKLIRNSSIQRSEYHQRDGDLVTMSLKLA